MAHRHNVYDSDTHFSINAITRQIKNESSKKTTLIQGDHNSERFSFDLPRFIEGHDMMNCNVVEVHFTNTDEKDETIKNKDFYEVKDMKINPDDENVIVFSWLIDERATLLAGLLEFQIKFKCVNDGVCEYKWNTAINSEISVSSALDNSEEVVERTPNVVDQWREEIFGDAENAVANINLAEQNAIDEVVAEGKKQLNDIAKAGYNISHAADVAKAEVKRDIFKVTANAIKGNAKGEIIQIDDVSKVDHQMNVKVHGKNLISLLKECDIQNVYHSWLVNPNTETVTLSITDKDTSVDISGIYFGFSQNGKDGTDGGALWFIQDGKIVRTSYTVSDRMFVSIFIADNEYLSAINALNERFNIQLEQGETATEYTPYIAPETVTVTEETTGATYTPNADGTCEIVSVSPTMTLLTDTEGVVIECEYNIDTKTYIDNKFEELAALFQV